MAVLNFDTKSVTLPSGEEAKSVFLTGSIDASTNQLFETELADLLSSGTNKVLLVLTNIKYINSTGLGTIVKCVDNFREHDGDIKLVGVPTKVIALFEMLACWPCLIRTTRLKKPSQALASTAVPPPMKRPEASRAGRAIPNSV